MTQHKPVLRRLLFAVRIVWTLLVVAVVTQMAAQYGWEHHGLVGALALGFAGIVVGAVLSLLSPNGLGMILDALSAL